MMDSIHLATTPFCSARGLNADQSECHNLAGRRASFEDGNAHVRVKCNNVLELARLTGSNGTGYKSLDWVLVSRCNGHAHSQHGVTMDDQNVNVEELKCFHWKMITVRIRHSVTSRASLLLLKTCSFSLVRLGLSHNLNGRSAPNLE
jgi:hypothetical protein